MNVHLHSHSSCSGHNHNANNAPKTIESGFQGPSETTQFSASAKEAAAGSPKAAHMELTQPHHGSCGCGCLYMNN